MEPLSNPSAAAAPALWQLTQGDGRLELRSARFGERGSVFVDFVGGKLGYSRRVPGSRLLFRAVGSRGGAEPTRIIDATAGLGRDAFLLAWIGYRVTAVERNPVVFSLLEDGLRRAMESTELREILGTRLQLVSADAREFLRGLPVDDAPDVVYLDPMFPPRTKSASVKKESEALRSVVGADADSAELLEAARAVARRHVVVKRMLHAPPIQPGVTRAYKGKTTRFDIYTPRR